MIIIIMIIKRKGKIKRKKCVKIKLNHKKIGAKIKVRLY